MITHPFTIACLKEGLDHRRNGRFFNPYPGFYNPHPKEMVKFLAGVARRNYKRQTPSLPLAPNYPAFLKTNRTIDTITFIGHATVLIQIGGFNILTDPVWGMRAGPTKVTGIKRYTPPGLAFADLPPIDIVLISHNHYDHLERSTICALQDAHQPWFFTPLGLARWFGSLGISRVVEMDWWEHTSLDSLYLHALPAQHFSTRGPLDQNRSLWCSWSVRKAPNAIYFGGDSGFFDGYREIGELLGPFDAALLPVGAAEPREVMRPMHMNGADALQAAYYLKARRMIPIHWGSFLLAYDYGEEPITQLRSAMDEWNQQPCEVIVLQTGATLRGDAGSPMESHSD